MTKQTCCRAHLCLLHSGLLMLHAHTRCCRPAIQPRTHTSANKRASWKFSRTPCVRCLSLAGGQGCACLPNLSAVDTAGSSSCCWLPWPRIPTTGQFGVCEPDSPQHAGQRRKSPNRNRLFQKSNHNSIQTRSQVTKLKPDDLGM